jgi:hypothetical protein
MAGFGGGAPTVFDARWYLTPETLLALGLGVIGSTPLAARLGRSIDPRTPVAAVARAALVAGLFATSLLFIAASSYNPFIYFKF